MITKCIDLCNYIEDSETGIFICTQCNHISTNCNVIDDNSQSRSNNISVSNINGFNYSNYPMFSEKLLYRVL